MLVDLVCVAEAFAVGIYEGWIAVVGVDLCAVGQRVAIAVGIERVAPMSIHFSTVREPVVIRVRILRIGHPVVLSFVGETIWCGKILVLASVAGEVIEMLYLPFISHPVHVGICTGKVEETYLVESDPDIGSPGVGAKGGVVGGDNL